MNLDGLAISPAGDVAATVPVGDGTGALVWAPAGASGVRVIARGERLGRVAVAGGRVAHVTGAGLREGVRVVVVDPAAVRDVDATGATARAARGAVAAALSPADRGEVLRGPAVYDVTSLSFDGAWLGFSTPSCLYVASASAATLPAGPCARTEIAAEPLRGTPRGSGWRASARSRARVSRALRRWKPYGHADRAARAVARGHCAAWAGLQVPSSP